MTCFGGLHPQLPPLCRSTINIPIHVFIVGVRKFYSQMIHNIEFIVHFRAPFKTLFFSFLVNSRMADTGDDRYQLHVPYLYREGLVAVKYQGVGLQLWIPYDHHHHSVFCLTTGPKPPLKRFLHIVRSKASSFKWEYPLLSLRSSSSSLCLLPRLLVTSISPFIFPSITCFRRQFVAICYCEYWMIRNIMSYKENIL